MVDLLDMDRVKRSGSMEQRLVSLEEQVGWQSGPGGAFCPVVTLRPRTLEKDGEMEVCERERGKERVSEQAGE